MSELNLDALKKLCKMQSQYPDEVDGNPMCAKCGEDVLLEDDNEPSGYCHDCAQEFAIEARTIIPQLIERLEASCLIASTMISELNRLTDENTALKTELEKLKSPRLGVLVPSDELEKLQKENAGLRAEVERKQLHNTNQLDILAERRKENQALRELLRQAQETIHDEFCGSERHWDVCNKIDAALGKEGVE